MQRQHPVIEYLSPVPPSPRRRSCLVNAVALLSCLAAIPSALVFAFGWGVGDSWVVDPRNPLALLLTIVLIAVPAGVFGSRTAA